MRFVRILALVGGVLLPALETWRRWGTEPWWPSLVDDWLIGAFLLAAWWLTRRGFDRRGIGWLSAAWGFACAFGYGSFFGHLREAMEQESLGPGTTDVSGLPHSIVLTFKGAASLLAVTALGVTLAHAGRTNTGPGMALR